MDGLVSFDILSNQINPEKKVNLDCNVKSKKFKLIEGLYNYQLGSQGENHTVAQISKHSLICICSYNYKESLKIIEIEDLFENINMTNLNNPGQLLIVSEEDLEQSKAEHIVKKSSQEVQQVQQQEEEDGWFDFLDISIYKYFICDSALMKINRILTKLRLTTSQIRRESQKVRKMRRRKPRKAEWIEKNKEMSLKFKTRYQS